MCEADKFGEATEDTPIKLKPKKGSKLHAHPERLAELGRQGGQKNRHWSLAERSIADRPLKSIWDVGELLEEAINRS